MLQDIRSKHIQKATRFTTQEGAHSCANHNNQAASAHLRHTHKESRYDLLNTNKQQVSTPGRGTHPEGQSPLEEALCETIHPEPLQLQSRINRATARSVSKDLAAESVCRLSQVYVPTHVRMHKPDTPASTADH